ncbi:MAG: ABC transporter substrate-binding protein [Actinomycetota bacterium]
MNTKSARSVGLVIGLIALFGAACGTTETDQTTEAAPAAASESSTTVTTVATTEPAETTAATEAAPADPDAPVLPVTVIDETGAEVTIESIDRIIPLDGTVAEVVFALGLGDQVVATDLSASYPPAADALPEIGYQRALAAEPIIGFDPTVLLATEIAGPSETLDDLRALGVPIVIVPNEATMTGPGEKIRAVATALGIEARGEALAAEVDRQIAENTVAATEDAPKVMALYIRGTTAQLVLGEASSTHWLIEAAGGVDLADELGVADAQPISAEATLVAAPDVLLVPSAGLDSVGGIDGLLEIAGLAETPAGQNRRVVTFDDQWLLGNGPRSGELLEQLRAALAE